tara:strand:- start:254 stop:523 length:270 start_codon:yes stop_codon:yes gene_type:complete
MGRKSTHRKTRKIIGGQGENLKELLYIDVKEVPGIIGRFGRKLKEQIQNIPNYTKSIASKIREPLLTSKGGTRKRKKRRKHKRKKQTKN